MNKHNRKILERIVEQGHCVGIDCSDDKCPLSSLYGDGFCRQYAPPHPDRVEHAKELLAEETLTREDVEEICLKQIAKYLEKDRPLQKPDDLKDKSGIEQLFVKGSVWGYGEPNNPIIVGSEINKDGIFYDLDGDEWNPGYAYGQLIDTGKVPIADHSPPEGVPFMGFFDDGAYNDFMIKGGEWYIRPSVCTAITKEAYTIEDIDAPDDITHWQISGAMANTAMQILRGE